MKVGSHVGEGCSNDIVMMDVRADVLDGIEPHLVDEIEIVRGERGRMRAEVIGGAAAALMLDDQADVERRRLLGLFPGGADQPRLIVG